MSPRSPKSALFLNPQLGRRAVRAVMINNSNGGSVGRIKEQLGSIHPQHFDKRLQAHRSHIRDSWDPRGYSPNPMIQPMPIRQQTQLFHGLPGDTQRELSQGFQTQKNQGRTRQRFEEIEPIKVSTEVPFSNPVTGRRFSHNRPPLL